jgi:hypothetical protein
MRFGCEWVFGELMMAGSVLTELLGAFPDIPRLKSWT